MLHLHVRDESGKHTLAVGAYREAIKLVRSRLGDKIFIQVTSEAGGIYTAEQQLSAVYEVCDSSDALMPDGVSIALREFIREDTDLSTIQTLFHSLARDNIPPQYILYSHDDIACYAQLCKLDVIPSEGHTVLLVLGKKQPDAPNAISTLAEMHDKLKESSGAHIHWMTCAFGTDEFQVLCETTKMGGHARVGFENCLQIATTGEVAADNAALVEQLVALGNPLARPLANIDQTREIMGAS